MHAPGQLAIAAERMDWAAQLVEEPKGSAAAGQIGDWDVQISLHPQYEFLSSVLPLEGAAGGSTKQVLAVAPPVVGCLRQLATQRSLLASAGAPPEDPELYALPGDVQAQLAAKQRAAAQARSRSRGQKRDYMACMLLSADAAASQPGASGSGLDAAASDDPPTPDGYEIPIQLVSSLAVVVPRLAPPSLLRQPSLPQQDATPPAPSAAAGAAAAGPAPPARSQALKRRRLASGELPQVATPQHAAQWVQEVHVMAQALKASEALAVPLVQPSSPSHQQHQEAKQWEAMTASDGLLGSTQGLALVQVKLALQRLGKEPWRAQDTLTLLQQAGHARVTPALLASTQIARVVGRLRKHASREVSEAARRLVEGWRDQLTTVVSSSPLLAKSQAAAAAAAVTPTAPAAAAKQPKTPAPTATASTGRTETDSATTSLSSGAAPAKPAVQRAPAQPPRSSFAGLMPGQRIAGKELPQQALQQQQELQRRRSSTGGPRKLDPAAAATAAAAAAASTQPPLGRTLTPASSGQVTAAATAAAPAAADAAAKQKRRPVGRWSQDEANAYVQVLRARGRDEVALRDALPNRNIMQIRNWYNVQRKRLDLEALLKNHGHPLEVVVVDPEAPLKPSTKASASKPSQAAAKQPQPHLQPQKSLPKSPHSQAQQHQLQSQRSGKQQALSESQGHTQTHSQSQSQQALPQQATRQHERVLSPKHTHEHHLQQHQHQHQQQQQQQLQQRMQQHAAANRPSVSASLGPSQLGFSNGNGTIISAQNHRVAAAAATAAAATVAQAAVQGGLPQQHRHHMQHPQYHQHPQAMYQQQAQQQHHVYGVHAHAGMGMMHSPPQSPHNQCGNNPACHAMPAACPPQHLLQRQASLAAGATVGLSHPGHHTFRSPSPASLVPSNQSQMWGEPLDPALLRAQAPSPGINVVGASSQFISWGPSAPSTGAGSQLPDTFGGGGLSPPTGLMMQRGQGLGGRGDGAAGEEGEGEEDEEDLLVNTAARANSEGVTALGLPSPGSRVGDPYGGPLLGGMGLLGLDAMPMDLS